MTYDLNRHIGRLLTDEPFWAALSCRLPKVACKKIPTACISYNRETEKMVMKYNPDFLGQLSDVHVRGIIKHEFFHVIFDHCTTRGEKENPKAWNYATDLAINSIIGKEELPTKWTRTVVIQDTELQVECRPLFPQQKDTPWEFLDWHQTSEHYYSQLKDKVKDESNQGGNDPYEGAGEAHDEWADDNPIAKEQMKDAIKKAAKEAETKVGGWGSMPTEVRELVRKSLIPTIDWRMVLMAFVRGRKKADRFSSMRKLNRRYPYIFAGKRTRRTSKILIAVDHSGSVDDWMLSTFGAELEGLSKYTEFYVIPFDDVVSEEHMFKWEKGKRLKMKRVLQGGTNFNAPTIYANENKFDGLIICTDMYAKKPIRSKCPRIWVTAEGCRPYFSTNEKILRIKREQ